MARNHQLHCQNEVSDLSLFDLPSLFSFSKHKSYRTESRSIAHAIAVIFTEEGFCADDLVERLANAGDDFRIKFNDLTREGFEFGTTVFQRWLANTDRWKGERTVERLQVSLRKQVLKFRSSQ